MIEKAYKSMNSQVTVNPRLIADTIDLINKSGKKSHASIKPLLRRPVTVAAAIVLCLALTTPVLAANVPAIYNLMYLVSPAVAQFFIPIQESCEDNGIRMEVVSTYIHDKTAEIYITMQDLLGDRIDASTDLFDSYPINRAFSSNATCQRVGYDAETKTATFLIQISEWGNRDITGSKLTFSVHEFLSHKTTLEDIPVGIALSDADESVQTQTVNIIGWSGLNVPQEEINKLLVPRKSIYTPSDGLNITAIGYIDGKLHIQLATAEKMKYDNHGYFYLMSKSGEQKMYDYSLSFADGINSEKRVDYQEFIFDIPKNELENYTLFGSFYTSGLRTEGNWRVTFPMFTN